MYNILIVPGGFEPPSTAPKAVMIGRYTTGLLESSSDVLSVSPETDRQYGTPVTEYETVVQ